MGDASSVTRPSRLFTRLETAYRPGREAVSTVKEKDQVLSTSLEATVRPLLATTVHGASERWLALLSATSSPILATQDLHTLQINPLFPISWWPPWPVSLLLSCVVIVDDNARRSRRQ
jgi:hypothetical protein